MSNQIINLSFSLPSWVSEYFTDTCIFVGQRDRMQLVLSAAKRNIKENTGGPFAAAIFESKSGKLVSIGVNLVPTEKLSILHAEMVAISLAQKKLGTYDLGAEHLVEHELVTSTEPCAMCFGAVPWSGIRRLVTGATDRDARSIGFDEGPKMANWQDELEARGIEVVTGVLAEEAKSVLEEYAQQGGHIYNSREG